MKPQNLHEPEPELEEPISEPSISTDGLRTLARIIAHHLERKRRLANYKADNTESDNEKQYIHRREKESHDD